MVLRALALEAILLLLALLQFSEIDVEAIEARVPEAPVLLQPIGDFAQRGDLQPARPPLRLLAPRHQPRPPVVGLAGDVASVEPESTTMISSGGRVCRSAPVSRRPMCASSLKQRTMSETVGVMISAGTGHRA